MVICNYSHLEVYIVRCHFWRILVQISAFVEDKFRSIGHTADEFLHRGVSVRLGICQGFGPGRLPVIDVTGEGKLYISFI